MRRLRPRDALLPLPLRRKSWWLATASLATLAATLLLSVSFDLIDTRLYDRVVAHNLRADSPDVVRIAIDAGVPLAVSREQMLTLEALAIERAVALGAEGVLLDAQIALRNYRKQSFAACLPASGAPQLCSLRDDERCLSQTGRARRAPLDLDAAAMQRLLIPTPVADRQPPPYDWLFGASLPARLIEPELPLARDGVVRSLFADARSMLHASMATPAPTTHDSCRDGSGRACMAIRFSDPKQVFSLPLSQLASCETERWQAMGKDIAGRQVVLQLTADDAPEDVHITPLATTLGISQGLLPGGRIIADGLQTWRSGDGPRPAPWPFAVLLGVILVAFTSASFAYLRTSIALLLQAGMLALLWHIAPLAYPYATWYATPILFACLVAGLTMLSGHMWLNTKHSRMLARFMPPQVRQVLLAQGSEQFAGRQVHAVVLMSDLAGYTTVTALLPSPKMLFALINDYLDAVTTGMQEQHGAWLEAYVGDMVCYYWPQFADDRELQRQQAINAAVDLMARQAAFFDALPQTLPASIPVEHRQRITALLFAGIALTEGDVYMGELGPSQGVRKFGILGDPVNVTARLEALTRVFSTKLIITSELLPAARSIGLAARRLATVQLKGRLDPADVWGLHRADEGISADDLQQWEHWLAATERGDTNATVPSRFSRDAQTICAWRDAGLWQADRQCFALDSK